MGEGGSFGDRSKCSKIDCGQLYESIFKNTELYNLMDELYGYGDYISVSFLNKKET